MANEQSSGVKYVPKFGRVLIKREIKEKTAGGIYIPDAKRHARLEGVIIGLGSTAGWTSSYDDSGKEIRKREFDIGDKVLFGRHAGAWIDASNKISGEENDDGTLFICQDEDILAVIKE